jgi:hypothetical protein
MVKYIDKELTLNIILSMVSKTRQYMGERKSAPYARAAKDILISLGIKSPRELDDLINRDKSVILQPIRSNRD